MIDGISSSFHATLVNLESSLFSDARRQRNPSEQKGMAVRVNTDATGLRLSAETQRVVEALKRDGLQQNTPDSSSAPNASAVFSGLLVGKNYPTYTATGGLNSGRAGLTGDSWGYAGANEAASPISPEKALAAYRRMSGETGLAPWGTGISVRI